MSVPPSPSRSADKRRSDLCLVLPCYEICLDDCFLCAAHEMLYIADYGARSDKQLGVAWLRSQAKRMRPDGQFMRAIVRR